MHETAWLKNLFLSIFLIFVEEFEKHAQICESFARQNGKKLHLETAWLVFQIVFVRQKRRRWIFFPFIGIFVSIPSDCEHFTYGWMFCENSNDGENIWLRAFLAHYYRWSCVRAGASTNGGNSRYFPCIFLSFCAVDWT